MRGGINRLSVAGVKAHVSKVRALLEAGDPKGAGRKLFDGGGLFLVVTPAGTPVWRVKYRFGAQERLAALGVYPGVSLEAARDGRERVKQQLRDNQDPAATKRLARAAGVSSSGDTFVVVKNAWLVKNKPGWSEPHFKTTSETLVRYATALDRLPVGQITDQMVGKLVEHVVGTARSGRGSADTAKKLLFTLRSIFRYAKAKGLCEQNPAESARELIPRRRQLGRRPAFLEWHPLGDILRRASRAQLSRAVHMAHRLTAFTAARVGNVIAAEWSEFAELDADVPTWVIPRAKMKAQDRHQDHRVILGPSIAAELREWKRVSGVGRYLFASVPSGEGHIVSEALSKLYRVTLGLKDKHTPHGWRAAFSTLANDSGLFEADAVEMALDHIHANDVIRAYDRGERRAERVKLANWWSERLSAAERGGAA